MHFRAFFRFSEPFPPHFSPFNCASFLILLTKYNILSLSVSVLCQVKVVGWILWFPIHAHFKVQMGCRGSASLPDEGYHLPRLDMLTNLHQVLRVMAIIGFHLIGMLDAYQVAITIILSREDHLAVERSIDFVLICCFEIDTSMMFAATVAIRANDFCPW